MGRRQLARLFARHLDASPSAVARTARMQRAKRLIDETDKPMVEIAILAGFGSLRRFNAVFAKVYGRAPTEIRRGRRSSRIGHETDPVGGNKNERARRLSNRSEGIAAK
jgi:AraC family transcriptional regulator of adaptative response / DNA-3-methyladenine glycosylase II